MSLLCVECTAREAHLMEHVSKRRLCWSCFRTAGKPPATIIRIPQVFSDMEEPSFVVSVIPEGINIRFEPK